MFFLTLSLVNWLRSVRKNAELGSRRAKLTVPATAKRIATSARSLTHREPVSRPKIAAASGLPDLGLRYLFACSSSFYDVCRDKSQNKRNINNINIFLFFVERKEEEPYPYLSIFFINIFPVFGNVRWRNSNPRGHLSDFYERPISSGFGYAVPSSW
jgi:hypothetical protein